MGRKSERLGSYPSPAQEKEMQLSPPSMSEALRRFRALVALTNLRSNCGPGFRSEEIRLVRYFSRVLVEMMSSPNVHVGGMRLGLQLEGMTHDLVRLKVTLHRSR